ncbi:hypothetical protein F9817_17040 [Vibrio sp. CAIM 722]|uniref:pectate lyase n=1 Tax=Vibrio eleionomae TaxID=2653505 RepID=A0A7X4RW66_9VIBR|nr:pectate lyase [Vibrio eleionomae]MZI94884.1 hypothetical protein [Vibrio eleionomae]
MLVANLQINTSSDSLGLGSSNQNQSSLGTESNNSGLKDVAAMFVGLLMAAAQLQGGQSNQTGNSAQSGSSQDQLTQMMTELLHALTGNGNTQNGSQSGISSLNDSGGNTGTGSLGGQSDALLQDVGSSAMQSSLNPTSDGGAHINSEQSPLLSSVSNVMDQNPDTFGTPSSPAGTQTPSTTQTSSSPQTSLETTDTQPAQSNNASANQAMTSVPSDTSKPIIDAESGARVREATTSQTTGSSVVPPKASSNPNVVNDTIVVKAGETFDGKGQTFTAGSALGDGGQSESQKPIFQLEDGASLKNVVIGDNGADGVHVYGDAKIDNVHWTNVGEDALTIKPSENGKTHNVEITNSSAQHAHDKIFQMNDNANIKIDNFTADDFGNFLISNNHQQGKWNIDLSNMSLKNGNYSVVNSFNKEGTTVNLDNISMDNVKRTYVLTDGAKMNVK